MEIPQIRLQSNSAKIGLDIQDPVQKIEQAPAELSIEQPKAIMNIETMLGKLTIDQTKAREDVDLKSIFKRTEEAANQGYQDWLAGMARRSEQGRELRHIEKGGSPFSEQAKQNAAREKKQFNIGWVPSHFSVKIQYEPARVEIDVQQQKPEISATTHKPVHEYTPGKVNVELEEKNSLDIDFVNLFPDEKE
ncbi:DUF6470 family protein [Bacillus massiliglaciei]|uniref:DUF6470 family protein n=1 Tax=Bacillus massiliglaciei TaxID=1816693 RepID=UPI000A9EA66C|nr:DUF6470 family protein [Bacillus massiliglaciei]